MYKILAAFVAVMLMVGVAHAGVWKKGDTHGIRYACGEPEILLTILKAAERRGRQFGVILLNAAFAEEICLRFSGPVAVKLVKPVGPVYTDDYGPSQIWEVRAGIIRGYTLVDPTQGPNKAT